MQAPLGLPFCLKITLAAATLPSLAIDGYWKIRQLRFLTCQRVCWFGFSWKSVAAPGFHFVTWGHLMFLRSVWTSLLMVHTVVTKGKRAKCAPSPNQFSCHCPPSAWCFALLALLPVYVWTDRATGMALLSGGHREFSKSKALLGSINAVQRSRVQDLQNPDEDKPLAPHWRVSTSIIATFYLCSKFVSRIVSEFFWIQRFSKNCLQRFLDLLTSWYFLHLQVQQRGVPATQEIISKLLEGLQIEDGRPVLLVDCLPNRFLDLFSILVAISNQPLHLLFSLEILFFFAGTYLQSFTFLWSYACKILCIYIYIDLQWHNWTHVSI